jgi:hypothetical protein
LGQKGNVPQAALRLAPLAAVRFASQASLGQKGNCLVGAIQELPSFSWNAILQLRT